MDLSVPVSLHLLHSHPTHLPTLTVHPAATGLRSQPPMASLLARGALEHHPAGPLYTAHLGTLEPAALVATAHSASAVDQEAGDQTKAVPSAAETGAPGHLASLVHGQAVHGQSGGTETSAQLLTGLAGLAEAGLQVLLGLLGLLARLLLRRHPSIRLLLPLAALHTRLLVLDTRLPKLLPQDHHLRLPLARAVLLPLPLQVVRQLLRLWDLSPCYNSDLIFSELGTQLIHHDCAAAF